MMQELITITWLGACFLALFGLAEWLHRGFRVQAEITRKIVHIGTGLLSLLFPLYLHQIWQVALLCGLFLVLLVFSKRKQFFSSINNIARPSYGSLLYPVSVFGIYCFYHFQLQQHNLFQPLYYFFAPVLLLAICDPVAALTGNMYKHYHPQTAQGKTFAGSTGFFISAFILCISLQICLKNKENAFIIILLNGVFTSIITTISEWYSGKGRDNLMIPLSAVICLLFFEQVT